MKPIVYLLREDDENEPLRYSLRSLSLQRHDGVFVVGHKPPWLTNVTHIPIAQHPIKGGGHSNYARHWNTTHLIEEAVKALDQEFIMMHDDIFFLIETHDRHLYHGGPTEAWAKKPWARSATPYARGFRATHELLKTWPTSQFYDLHTPMLVIREVMQEALDITEQGDPTRPPFKRTIYGNLMGGLGIGLPADVKYGHHVGEWDRLPFVSTDTNTWPMAKAGGLIRKMFQEPSVYEGDQ